MIGLNGSLSIAENALAAQYAGIAVANNNIANANTPGYSRQVVQLSSVAYQQNGIAVEGGVAYTGTTSIRDQVLNLAINQQTSQQTSLTAQSTLLAPVNTAFSSTTTGIGTDLSNLFSSLSSLSTTPSSTSARQSVLTAAAQLVNDFHQGAAALSSASTTADQQVTTTVAQINQLTQQIATLNGKLAQVTAAGQAGSGVLQDQRDQLTNQLAQLTGVFVTQTESTPNFTTANGSPLVLGSTAYSLQVTTGSDGKAHVLDAQGQDITAQLTGGTLAGAIATRDTTLPALSSQLDGLASQFASAMNTAQASGYDLTGSAGAPMFSIPTGTTGAAQAIAVTLSNPSGIALSSSATAQDTGNLSALLGVQTAALPSGATPTNTYAAFVGQVGTAAAQVSTQLTAANASLSQLSTQRDSESAVSIDQETVNLVRFQQAYTAAAKVIATIDSLYSTVMNMASQVTG